MARLGALPWTLWALGMTEPTPGLPSGGGGGDCSTPADCMINGDCIDARCVCDAGWHGPHCGKLALLPAADPDVGSYVAPGGTSSWGFSVAQDDAGAYHGFVSEFSHGCKLGSWTQNSYINHVVADRPSGPWRQAGVAAGAWSHNARILRSPTDGKWLLYGIMSPFRGFQDCGGPSAPPGVSQDSMRGGATQGGRGTSFPFAIKHADSPDGPWADVTGSAPPSANWPAMTLHQGWDNAADGQIEGKSDTSVGILLRQRGGVGSILIPRSSFASYTRNGKSVLAWDACSPRAAAFDTGAPVWTEANGSLIAGFEVVGGKIAVRYSERCIMTFSYANGNNDLQHVARMTDGFVDTAVGYLELTPNGDHPNPTRMIGHTQDAKGCRGACEAMRHGGAHGTWRQGCTSFTWRGSEGGACYVRADYRWHPISAPPNVISGRPWHGSTGDNPAPWIDPISGNVTVLWRTYAEGGSGRVQQQLCLDHSPACGASLIGAAWAPSWRGPYTAIPGPEDGPISILQYPAEENEDPFLWRDGRGWHALMHANTWGNSRSQHFPTAQWAGRYAYSLDGISWQYSTEPPFSGIVKWHNGSSSAFARRERPFILFDADGRPSYLYTGVQRYTHDEYTFSLAQPIDLSGPAPPRLCSTSIDATDIGQQDSNNRDEL